MNHRIIISVLIIAAALAGACSKAGSPVKIAVKPESPSFGAGCYDSRTLMINDLGLTDDQTGRILDIDEKYNILYRTLKGSNGRIRMLKEEHRVEIEKSLTKQQAVKFNEVFMNRWAYNKRKEK